MDLKSKIREIQDFPKPGIGFKDITTLLADAEAFTYSIDQMVEIVKDIDFDCIIAPEARGFIMGTPLAYKLEKPFIPIRKKGKLPYKTVSKTFDLEYGQDTLYMHADAIKPGDKVLLVDDLLATGGTVAALRDLVEEQGANVVKAIFLIELDFLKPRDSLIGIDISSLIHYE